MSMLRVINATRGTLLADRAAIADSSAKRRTGLLKHSGLAPGEGLWIAPCEGVHTFGMNFAIDVIFLDRKRMVRKIRPNMSRRKISLSLCSHSVLELPAGRLAETGTIAGDQLEFEKYDSLDNFPPNCASMSAMRTLVTLFLAVAISFGVMVAQQPPAGGGAAKGGGGGAPHKNLKILPDDANLVPTMRAFMVALGVMDCNFCHDPNGGRDSDANPNKNMARMMLAMVKDINAKFPDAKEHVTCYTCHRGAEKPLTVAP